MIERRPRGSRSKAGALILAAASAQLLGGCVAAALPVLAAGGLATTRLGDQDETRQPEVRLPAEPRDEVALARTGHAGGAAVKASNPATVREAAFADGSKVTVTNALPRDRDPAATTRADRVEARLTGLTELPAPAAGTRREVAAQEVAAARLTDLRELPPPKASYAGDAGSSHASFADYAARQAAIPIVGGERRSALLADSASMEPVTRDCSIHPAAVLVDLDPSGATVDLSQPLTGDPALAARLAQLRAEGVTVGWTSSRTADQAGAIRKALVTAGLDPVGRDELVLLRFPEERKQTRRDEFARSHCVVAIAGDERADFDELFAYLRNPAAAQPLETLIGAGWFIIPSPLTPN
jgi:hypothetical protein